MSRRVFIIAEAGVNHNGSLDRAIGMVDAAAAAGADCVKFQAFDPEKLVARGTRSAEYQTRNTGEGDQLELIRSLALSRGDFERLAHRCRARDVEFLATAFDVDMIDFLVGLGMKRIKVASGELTNHPALRRFAQLRLPIVLSTGMADDGEIDTAVAVLRSAGAGDVTLLQCTSIYPAPVEHTNLLAMPAMGARNRVPYGYSDHTLGDHIAIAAAAMGAVMIEKHFTMDRGLPGPDHKASLVPAELSAMVHRIRDVEKAIGAASKAPGPEERETATLVRRSWHAARGLRAGSIIAHDDIALKRPAHGLPPSATIVGRRLVRDLATDQPIMAADVA